MLTETTTVKCDAQNCGRFATTDKEKLPDGWAYVQIRTSDNRDTRVELCPEHAGKVLELLFGSLDTSHWPLAFAIGG